jgi:hypothetical protein
LALSTNLLGVALVGGAGLAVIGRRSRVLGLLFRLGLWRVLRQWVCRGLLRGRRGVCGGCLGDRIGPLALGDCRLREEHACRNHHEYQQYLLHDRKLHPYRPCTERFES